MLWFDKDELQFFHPNNDGRCYCELLLAPNDLTLQAQFADVGAGATYRISWCRTNGDNVQEIAEFGRGLVATDSHGNCYLTYTMDTFPDAICTGFIGERCFVVRIEVYQTVSGVTTTLFDKYTQPYCIADCCISNGELFAGEGNTQQRFTNFQSISGTGTHCGKPLIRIISRFDCFDNFTGDYYGSPIRKIFGINNTTLEHIPFQKVTNIAGLFKPNPTDIQITVSKNCKVQKTEATDKWMVQGSEFVPTWKMKDIESQFKANFLMIDGDEYTGDGGVMFEKVRNFQVDWRADYFKFETVVSECRKWNIFGCGVQCASINTKRIIGIDSDLPIVLIADSGGTPIALNIIDFKLYLSSMDGVVEVTDVSYIYTPYGYQYAFAIESLGYIPPYFYLNAVGEQFKIFAVDELMDITIPCSKAQIGTITDIDANCPSALIGNITDIAVSQVILDVYSSQEWIVVAGGTVTVSGNLARLNFTSRNVNFGSGQPYPFVLSGDIVGWVGEQACPAFDRTINQNLPADVTVIVLSTGEIRWYGPINTQVSYGEVLFTNVIYNI